MQRVVEAQHFGQHPSSHVWHEPAEVRLVVSVVHSGGGRVNEHVKATDQRNADVKLRRPHERG